jgi:hypothetical protein
MHIQYVSLSSLHTPLYSNLLVYIACSFCCSSTCSSCYGLTDPDRRQERKRQKDTDMRQRDKGQRDRRHNRAKGREIGDRERHGVDGGDAGVLVVVVVCTGAAPCFVPPHSLPANFYTTCRCTSQYCQFTAVVSVLAAVCVVGGC